MNYLAHAYLSFKNPEILVGNMMSDFIKGAAHLSFSGNILKGIMLHRHIDEFTDHHPATQKAKQFFRPAYRLYSGAIVDVLYDHFLANDPSQFTPQSLEAFTLDTYQTLSYYTNDMNPGFLRVFGYMRAENWLYNYRGYDGMRKSLAGLVHRSAYLTESETAYNLFLEHYVQLNECYDEFFGDVKEFAKQKLETLLL